MPGYGRDSWGSVVEEAEYGTTPGTGETYFEIVSEDVKLKCSPIKRKSLRGVSPRFTYLGHKTVGGPINLDMLFEGLGLFIKHGMGGYDFTADTPVEGANTHVFTLADTLPTGLSVELCKGNIPSGKVFLYEGGKVDTLDFKFADEQCVGMDVGMIFQSETPNTAASDTPTYPGDHPVLYHYAGTLTLAGTASLNFKSGNIMLNNNLPKDRFLMSQSTREPLRNIGREVTGAFTIEYADLALYDKWLVPTTGALTLAYTSTEMITGTTPYTATFSMVKAQLAGEPAVVQGEGTIEVTYPFIGLHNNDATDALTITLVNAASTLA